MREGADAVTTGARPSDPLPEARLRPRGSNQGGMRQFNERVVLQAIRLQGSVPKAEIARLGKRCAVLDPKKISMSDTVAVMTGALPPDRIPAECLAH